MSEYDPLPTKPGQIAIERKGTQVSLTIHCQDDYEAIMAYDQWAAALRRGLLRMSFRGTRPAKPPVKVI